MSNYQTHFTEHAGRSFAKQLALADYLGKHHWSLDIKKATADFGHGRVHPIELIGTEAESDHCFMWAWANEQSNLPATVTKGVASLREWGRAHEVPELLERELPLQQFPAHDLAMLATGVLQAGAYYRGPYEGGAVYFMVNKLPPLSPIPTERLVRVVSQVICQWSLDGRTMAESFLKMEGFSLVANQSNETVIVRATHEDGRSLDLTFDQQRRMTNVSSVIKPRSNVSATPPTPQKSGWKRWFGGGA